MSKRKKYKPLDNKQVQDIELFFRAQLARLCNGTGDLSAQLEVALLCFERDNTNFDHIKTLGQGVVSDAIRECRKRAGR